MGTGASFPENKAAREEKLKLKMNGDISPLAPYVFMARFLTNERVLMAWYLVTHREKFTFYLVNSTDPTLHEVLS
jgi:hypothetical protein